MRLPDGTRRRVSGTPSLNSKRAAEDAERAHVARLLSGRRDRKEVPTFEQWFDGVFWTEHVEVENSPGEADNKDTIYHHHLAGPLGALPLDAIDVGRVSTFRAQLASRVREGAIAAKYANNILSVLSRALTFAVDVGVLDAAPPVRMFRAERPEIEWWEVHEYAALLAAARDASPEWHAAVCLAGEAGLRVAEVRGLRWREDVDLSAETITVHQQLQLGAARPPKGGRRRTVPMTPRLVAALRALDVVRVGPVIRGPGRAAPTTEGEAQRAILRICARAGLPARQWHTLRHTFGTHAAMLGVNPWRLQAWMGHASIETTMRYVHVVEAHRRPIPPELHEAGEYERDPDRRVLVQLGLRGNLVATASDSVA